LFTGEFLPLAEGELFVLMGGETVIGEERFTTDPIGAFIVLPRGFLGKNLFRPERFKNPDIVFYLQLYYLNILKIDYRFI